MFKVLILFVALFMGCTSTNAYHANKPTRGKHHNKQHISRVQQFNNDHNEWDTLEFTWPTSGILTSPFGMRTLRHRTQMHTGIDIAANTGTPVHASESGRIVFTGTKKGYGKVIIIRHDTTHETLYGHLNRSIVKNNQIVRRNQLIGYIGRTGRVTGSNLHFETRVNGIAKDPLNRLPGSLTFSGKRRVHVGELIDKNNSHVATVKSKKDKKS